MENPSIEYHRQLLRYIRGTTDLTFVFGSSDDGLNGHSDSDYAADQTIASPAALTCTHYMGVPSVGSLRNSLSSQHHQLKQNILVYRMRHEKHCIDTALA